MNELVTKFNDSLVISSADVIGDYLELGIDSVMDNEILKEVPIFKSLLSVINIYGNIRERNCLKNLTIFINELNSGNILTEKLKSHQEELKNNPKKAEKELGRILIILDQTIDNQKAFYYGKLYKAYINEIISWDLFVEFCEINDRLYIGDFNLLALIYNKSISDTTNRKDLYKIERLNSVGVIGLTPKSIRIGRSSSRQDSYISLNETGRLYTTIIFN